MATALKIAIETLASAPHPPTADSIGAVRDKIVRDVKRFESDVAQWRSNVLALRSPLTSLYKGLSTLLSVGPLAAQMQDLDEFIEEVDREIESERLALERSKLSSRQTIADISKRATDTAKFAKKILKRLYEAGVEQHNARVDFYHFLLDLRAEYNPDYHGGPVFDNAEDLIADLRKHAR